MPRAVISRRRNYYHLFILYRANCLSFESPRSSSARHSQSAGRYKSWRKNQWSDGNCNGLNWPWINRGSRNFVGAVLLATQREARSFRWKIETRIIMRDSGVRGDGISRERGTRWTRGKNGRKKKKLKEENRSKIKVKKEKEKERRCPELQRQQFPSTFLLFNYRVARASGIRSGRRQSRLTSLRLNPPFTPFFAVFPLPRLCVFRLFSLRYVFYSSASAT